MNVLQDRPGSTTPPGPAPRRRSRRGAVVGLGAVALAGLALLGVNRALDAIPSPGNPFTESVVDRQRPALQLALSDLAEYHAAKGTFQVLVDLEKDTQFVPGVVKGERTTYLAVGTVDGLVDFRGLGSSAVQVDGQRVTVTLPPARLGEPAVDLEQSRVLSRDRGLVDRIGGAFSDSPTSEREVALKAEDRLVDAAAESDLLRRTEDSTRAMLTGLAGSLGYTDVVVEFAPAAGT